VRRPGLAGTQSCRSARITARRSIISIRREWLRYDQRKIDKLLGDAGIVRNRLKVAAAIQNAKAFLAVQKEFQSFDTYIWKFVGGKPKKNNWGKAAAPSRTAESDAMSKDLQLRGFKFVGTTICYAFMQAVGMVNDHEQGCFRRGEIISSFALWVELPDLLVSQSNQRIYRVRRVWPEDSTPATRPIQAWPHPPLA